MNILDIIIIICCIPVLIGGYQKGFIRQVISIFALLIGIWIASGLGELIGGWVLPAFKGWCDHPEQVANLVGFCIVMLVVMVSLGLIGKLVEKIILVVVPDWFNKLLGVILAGVNIILVCSVLCLIFNFLNGFYFFIHPNSSLLADSTLYPMIESCANALLPNIQNILL